MSKLFKGETLIEADRVDSMGDFFPQEVMEKAVAEAQERIATGTPLLVTKNFSEKLNATQGLVSEIWMEGPEVKISGVILDTDPGLAVQELLPDIEYAIHGEGLPEVDPKTQVKTYQDLRLISVSAVSKGVKVR